MTLPEHARRNREEWTAWAPEYAGRAPRAWAREELTWGVWGVPERELRVLPERLEGLDVVELGCGTAYVSAWLARRGARPVGVDVTPAQLETARRMQAEFGLRFPLVEASAEAVPLPNASFDLAVSEYGASIWADPDAWVSEAARLLRPGGELAFLVNGTLAILCAPDEEAPPGTELLRPYFGLHRLEWPGDRSVEFHLGYGDWIRLLRRCGLEVVDLVEVRAPASGEPHPYPALPERWWARRWPSEQIWKARKPGP
ncbi:MAG TPA: class I SAM-dependent methyltransferase [Gaiellaceae bacterium]|nr:class I SAM-dependent methyltransferase [Gaiellaceae bacterium]